MGIMRRHFLPRGIILSFQSLITSIHLPKPNHTPLTQTTARFFHTQDGVVRSLIFVLSVFLSVMAPRKKAEETKTKPSTTPATRRSARMTRSAAKRLNARLTELPTDAGKKRKQGKAVESKKKVKTETVSATSSESQPEVNTLEEEEDEDEDEANEEDAKEESTSTGDGVNKTIVIEHCKQCIEFKTRAMQVKDGLLRAFPGISVLLNSEMPRRGCFEIREEGGETFISLRNMKRPFPPLKGLDIAKVISNIIDRVKSSTIASN